MISESGVCLDVSFLTLSEDKFLHVMKKMGDYSMFFEGLRSGKGI